MIQYEKEQEKRRLAQLRGETAGGDKNDKFPGFVPYMMNSDEEQEEEQE